MTAYTVSVLPGEWNVFSGVWVLVKADPLNIGKPVLVTVHPDLPGVMVDTTVPGLRVQLFPPRQADDFEGQPS